MTRFPFVIAFGMAVLGSMTTSAQTPPPLLTSWSSPSPSALAVDINDINSNVYVLSRTLARVTKYDADGNYLMQWGSYGGEDGQFDRPSGIAVSASGLVYVADYGNGRVQVFTDSGEFISSWYFQYSPYDVAIDRNGYVYVTAAGIYKSEADGSGQFLFSESPDYTFLAIDWHGVIRAAAAHPGQKLVRIVSASGMALAQWDIPEYATGMGLDSSGDVYVSCMDGVIRVYDLSGTHLMDWVGFAEPSGIEINLAGNVYVADPILNRVYKYGTESPPIAIGVARLSWDGCDPIVQNKDYSGPASYRLICSISDSSIPNSGHESEIIFRPSTNPGFPDAWRFDPSGCQAGLLQVSSSGVSKACQPYNGGDALIASEFDYDSGSGEAVMTVNAIYDEFSADPSRRHVLWRADFDHTGSQDGSDSPAGGCGSAGDPMCIIIREIGILIFTGTVPVPLDSDYVTWNDVSNLGGCPGSVQAQATTWGRVKTLYR